MTDAGTVLTEEKPKKIKGRSKGESIWRFDFAGPHGTAWGTVNLCGAVVTVTALEWTLAGAPWWWAGATALAGSVGTLLRSAFRRRAVEPTTVAYQLACWVGAGTWSGVMLAGAPWGWEGWARGVGGLALAAGAAGVMAGLWKREPESGDRVVDAADMAGMARVARAEKYEAIINHLSNARPGKARVRISGIEDWANGAGHSVEGMFLSGSWGMDALSDLLGALAVELDLPEGCDIAVRRVPGKGRRTWIMDVNTRNNLHKGCEYPLDKITEPWTINGPIPIGIRPSDEWMCVELRQRNLAFYGMNGAGKTVGLKSLISSLILAADCIPVVVDLSGGDLYNHFMTEYRRGGGATPPLMAVGSLAAAEAAARALIRISYARKSGYGRLYEDSDASLLPIGDEVDGHMVPQIMFVMDETTTTLRSIKPENEALRELLLKGVAELRGGGIRYVFPPLTGDNRFIGQDFQKMIHTVIVGQMESAGEYRLTVPDPVDPAFFVAQGYGLCRQSPGAKLEPFRWFGDAKPSVLRAVVEKAGKLGSLGELDPLSLAAANGRRADGTPWPAGPEMLPSDRDWWDKNWGKWDSEPELPAAAAVTPPAMTSADIQERVDGVMRAAEAARERAEAGATIDVEADVARAEKADWRPDWLPAIPGKMTWRQKVRQALIDAGSDGLRTGQILELAGADRGDVMRFLASLRQEGVIERMERGLYVARPEDASGE